MGITKALLDALNGVDLARFWAGNEVRVLPVAPAPAKRPLIGAWQDKATDDRQVIEAWWRQHPEARVGIATGDPGFDVLDFDVAGGKPGIAQMKKLLDLGIIESGTFYLVGTPSGGCHLYFKGTNQRNKQNEKAIPGVDFRGAGGMVLAAGNPGYTLLATPHAGLGGVSWDAVRQALAPAAPPANERPPARPGMPPQPTASPGGYRSSKLVDPIRGYDDPIGEESPLDWYTRNTDITDLLAKAGWTFVQEQGGRLHYRRPEKRDGISGNVATMPDGRTVFFNFSSSVDLPINTAMSAAQLHAHLEYGGDMGAAAKAIRKTLMPQRAKPTPPPTVLSSPPDAGEEKALVPVAETFWDERIELRDIRWLARERRVSPWSVLGCVLALVSCRVGPHVVLPPIVGSVASLNLLVGLVGPSGKGKGASWGVGLEYLGYGYVSAPFAIEEITTAEGIDATFTETPPRSAPVQYNDVAFFNMPEVDRLKSQSENSALLSQLRKVWSGELLGGKTAAKERWRPVRPHTYRASAVIGIQPRRAGTILGDADGGLPQRFLWMPVHDPGALRRTDKLQPPIYIPNPPQVDQDVWIPEGEQRGDKGEPEPVQMKSRWEVPVCELARNEIIDAREENLVSEHGGIDSHALLTQLKTAALLAFLFREYEVTEEHWRLARVVMKISDQTREWCEREIRSAVEAEHKERGYNRAVQSTHEEISRVVIKDRRAQRVQELGSRALGKLQAEPGREWSRSALLKAVADRDNIAEFGDDIWAALLATPGVVQGPEVSSGGKKVRKVAWTPSNLLEGRTGS